MYDKLIVEGIYLEIPAGRHVINFVYQHDQNIPPSPPINEDVVYLDDFKLSETALTPRKGRNGKLITQTNQYGILGQEEGGNIYLALSCSLLASSFQL